MKWRNMLGVFCDRRITVKLKRKFFKTAIRLAKSYGTDYWGVKKQNFHKMRVIEMINVKMDKWK